MRAEDDLSTELMLEQHRELWQRINQQHLIRWETQKFGLLGIAAFYSVLTAKEFSLPGDLECWVLLFPTLLAILGFLLHYGLRMSASQMAQQIAKFEERAGLDGWETGQGSRRDKEGISSLPITMTNHAFWALLVASTLAFALSFERLN